MTVMLLQKKDAAVPSFASVGPEMRKPTSEGGLEPGITAIQVAILYPPINPPPAILTTDATDCNNSSATPTSKLPEA
jgi:hypothetical protein